MINPANGVEEISETRQVGDARSKLSDAGF